MYHLHIHRTFDATHALRLYDGTMEPWHRHHWQVRVTVAAAQLDAIDVVIDFHELERIVDAAIAPLANQTLNDLPPFAAVNPSAERVAEHLYGRVAAALPEHVALYAVRVTEAPGCCASYMMDDR